jgi:hypothetical protein
MGWTVNRSKAIKMFSWKEVEFIAIQFISVHTKKHRSNLQHRSFLAFCLIRFVPSLRVVRGGIVHVILSSPRTWDVRVLKQKVPYRGRRSETFHQCSSPIHRARSRCIIIQKFSPFAGFFLRRNPSSTLLFPKAKMHLFLQPRRVPVAVPISLPLIPCDPAGCDSSAGRTSPASTTRAGAPIFSRSRSRDVQPHTHPPFFWHIFVRHQTFHDTPHGVQILNITGQESVADFTL